jgi:hypothetical protein
MSYTAVIFDLFGTLVNDIAGPPYDLAAKQMASILSVPLEEFNRLWFSTIYERSTGSFSNLEENIRYICYEIGIAAKDKRIEKAAEVRTLDLD